MKITLILCAVMALFLPAAATPQPTGAAPATQVIASHWKGKKVAFLGDSITDSRHVGTAKNYWQFLAERLGIESWVYGINGHQWSDILGQAEKLKAEHGGDADALFVFAGANDYNADVPLGDWWTVTNAVVNTHGNVATKPRRIPSLDNRTFRGRINIAMAYLRENFPDQQIILLTPIHRAFATFGGKNIQPDESYPNDIGLYVDAYVDVVKEAGSVWSVPVIDLYATSGLFPLTPSHAKFFHDRRFDRLHPSAVGHDRLARTMLFQMLALPSDFK